MTIGNTKAQPVEKKTADSNLIGTVGIERIRDDNATTKENPATHMWVRWIGK